MSSVECIHLLTDFSNSNVPDHIREHHPIIITNPRA